MYYFYLCVHVYVSVCGCVRLSAVPAEAWGLSSSGTGVSEGCKLPDVGAGIDL